jgi:hypothetical protein
MTGGSAGANFLPNRQLLHEPATALAVTALQLRGPPFDR